LQEILVCLEGSPSTERAIVHGIALARRLGAGLRGLAIVDEPDIRAGTPSGIGGSSYKQQRDRTLLEDAQNRSEEWMLAFTDRCRAAGLERNVEVVKRIGRPAAIILEELARSDLAVLGREVNFRFETDEDDRKTRDSVLHHARKPMLVVPEKEDEASEAVLIAYDGSSASRRAVESFAASGLAAGRPLHMVSVDDEGARAWEMADRGAETLRAAGMEPTLHNVVSTLSIAGAILELQARLNAGLIVMGAYAHSRIAALIWGSVTRELVDKTTVPLFLHH
jgi:nucleotide-binding universal stress UspA family protein